MNRNKIFIAVCLGLLILAACTTEEEPNPTNSITGIVWQWESVTNKPANETTTVPDPENYTLIFSEDETFSGTAELATPLFGFARLRVDENIPRATFAVLDRASHFLSYCRALP